VAAVAEVLLLANNGEGQIRELLVAQADEKRRVVARVVAHQYGRDLLCKLRRYAVEHLGQRGRCVVRNDDDANPHEEERYQPSGFAPTSGNGPGGRGGCSRRRAGKPRRTVPSPASCTTSRAWKCGSAAISSCVSTGATGAPAFISRSTASSRL